MIELMIEILGYIAVAALLGFLLGWLTWGWGQRDRISAARAEGAREARTSVDGAAGLRDQLRASADERARLEAEIDRLTERLAAAEVAAGLRADDTVEPAEDDADKAAASPGPVIAEEAAAEGRPTTPGRGSAPAIPADGDTPERPPSAAGRARDGRRAGASGGGPTSAPVPDRPAERPPAAASDDRPRRADELAARLASYGPPDVTLRKQIMSGSGAADEGGPEPDASASGSEPEMPRPPGFTLRRQRVTGSDEPPVADEQVPPQGGQAGVPDMPRPASSTLRQQRPPEGADEPPVIDEQMPPGPEYPAGARPDDAVAPASLMADRPAEIDDLRRIRGVGKVTERLLNRNGIWLYRQLAGLTPAETAWLARVLDMPLSRIERERWVEQAGSLHRGKYGSAEDGTGS